MSDWKACVIDAEMGVRDGMFCFCPVTLDADGEIADIVTGMNYIGERPPKHLPLIAIVHSDGQVAVEAFCAEHRAALDALNEPPAGPPPAPAPAAGREGEGE